MERRLLKPLADFDANDIQGLIDGRVPEGQRLEYKRQLDLEKPKEKHEAAKDVSGFGNATGGLVIYGIEERTEEDGSVVPVRLTPLTDGSARTRLEDVLDSTVFPHLNMDARMLEVEGGYCLLVRAFQRSGPLHMVEGFADGRHYLRVGHKTRRMSQHEIERAYAELSGREGRLEQVLVQAPLIARLARTRTEHQVALASQGKEVTKWRPWMYVVTAPLDAGPTLLTMRNPSRQDFPESREGQLSTGGLGLGAYTLDAGGYIQEMQVEDSADLIQRRMRLYRSGVLEWGWRFHRDDFRSIPSSAFFEYAHDALLYFARVYADVGYRGRLRIWVGIDNADEGIFWVPRGITDFGDEATEQNVDDLRTLEDGHVDTLLQSPMSVLSAAMDYIWQAFGHPRCLLVSETGEYIKPR